MLTYPQIKKLIFATTAILSIAASPFLAEARGLISSDEDPLIPLCAITNGSCQPCDIIELVAHIIDLLIGVLGIALLIMFVIGGITLLLSQGNSDKISKGTGTMKNAVIGAIIVMLAWTIVNITIGALTGGGLMQNAVPLFGNVTIDEETGEKVVTGGSAWNICEPSTKKTVSE